LAGAANAAGNESDASAPAFGVIRDFDSVRFVFLPRPGSVVLGAFLIFSGLIVLGFAVVWNALLWRMGVRSGSLVFWAFALFGLVPIVIGVAMVWVGRAIWQGRWWLEVILQGRTLWRVDRFGPVRIRNRLRLREGVQVGTVTERANFPVQIPKPGAGGDLMTFSLVVYGGVPDKFTAVWGYPEAVMNAFGRALTEELNVLARREGWRAVTGWVEGSATEAFPAQPPAGSCIEIHDFPDGCLVHVPRLGLIRGTRGFFPFALLWTVVSVGIVVVALVAGAGASNPPPVWLVALFPLAGVVMLLVSVHMGYRETWIAIKEDLVGIRQQSPLRKFERRLNRAEIVTVQIGPSGVEVNHRPVMELQLLLRDGRKVGLASQLSEPELFWLAELARRRLGLAERGPRNPMNDPPSAGERTLCA
jgi:hypothetical protein